MKINVFPMQQVENLDPYCQNALEKDVLYLLAFDRNKLLAGFRETAGLDTKGAVVYGGWENMLIGGHTMGHYLSAMAQAYANPSVSEEEKKQIFSMLKECIDGLLECQKNSKGEPGFVFGAQRLPEGGVEQQFDNVEKGMTHIITQAWVPWYTMHKILAGVVETYELTGYAPALELAKGIGDWTCNRTGKWDHETHMRTLATEYGGMNDALYELYLASGEEKYAVAAHRFDQDELFERVATEGEDVLNNHHANTTIPKFMGALNRYVTCHGKIIEGEVVDASKYLRYAQIFWQTVVDRHTYITGGNSEWEHFGKDYVLNAERTNCNNETCNVYNMLKMSRLLFACTGEKKYADYYENTFVNSILSSQNPETGMTTYFQPMSSGYFKVYGERFTKFWCCTGSGMENFTKLNDSIYYHDADTIFVNLYESSKLTWEEKGVTLLLQSALPEQDTISVKLGTISGEKASVNLALRLPDWLSGTSEICVNGEKISYENRDGFAFLPAIFENGTEITMTLPMKVVAYPLPDNKRVIGFKYGPVVLSANLGMKDMATTMTGVAVTIPAKKVVDGDLYVLPEGVDTEAFVANADKYFTPVEGAEKLALKLEGCPYVFETHYTRYKERYSIYLELVTAKEQEEIERRRKDNGEEVLDTVQPGYGQYENDELHDMRDKDSVGVTNDGTYRYAPEGGFFAYRMTVDPQRKNVLSLTLRSEDKGKNLQIKADGRVIFAETLNPETVEITFPLRIELPDDIVAASEFVFVNGEAKNLCVIEFSGVDGAACARVCDFIYTIGISK